MKVVFRNFLFACLSLFILSGFFVNALATSDNLSVHLTTCGNGLLETGEGCDGSNLNGQTCVTKGYNSGILGCSSNCTFDTSNCQTGGGCTGSGCNPPSDNPPEIYQVTTSTQDISATVSWLATDTDATGVSSVSFSYGIGVYGVPEVVLVTSNGIYSKNLLGLLSNQIYNFKITVSDGVNLPVNVEGTFKTLPLVPTALTISNINSEPNETTCQISWQTNYNSTGQVLYGTSTSYGGQAEDSQLSVSHSVLLGGLHPSTTYHYKVVATDQIHSSNSTVDLIFITPKDDQAPSDVDDLKVSVVGDSLHLTWTNPALTGDNADFVGVKIYKKIGSAPAFVGDGTSTYSGNGTSFTDDEITRNVHYYYKVFSYDTSLNYSNGVSVNGLIPPLIVPNVSNYNLTVIDNTIELTWVNPVSTNFVGVKIIRKVGGHSSGIYDGSEIYDGNLQIFTDGNVEANKIYYYTIFSYNSLGGYSTGVWQNGQWVYVPPNCQSDCSRAGCCADPVCTNLDICRSQPKPEICGNGLDDDNNGKTDCADSACVGFAGCSNGSGGGVFQCSDSVDNDNDGLIDYPADPGCDNANDNDEYNPPVSTTSTIKLSDLFFLAGNRKINLVINQGKVGGLAGIGLTVGLPATIFKTIPVSIKLIITGSEHQFVLDTVNNNYFTEITFPSTGLVDAFVVVDYGKLMVDSLNFKLNLLPYGNVLDDTGNRLNGAEVFLYQQDGSLVGLANYNEINPILTDTNGFYGWIVPNDSYYLVIKKDGYNDRKMAPFTVTNNIINQNLSLIKLAPKLEEVIDANVSLAKNVANVAVNLAQKTKVEAQIVIQAVADIKQNLEVQKITRQIVAPTAVGVAVASTLPLISFGDVIPLLRLLFLQPLLLFGRRKRSKWGQIYNSLNKQPIDLAIVRLVDAESNKIVQSKVTDREGRYAFVIEPGRYKMEVQKLNFVFPSSILKAYKSDGQKVDIYHGEVIEVTEKDSLITANIPLDLEGEHQKPKRLLWQKVGHITQTALSRLGLLVTLVSFYISPTWLVGSLLAVHILLTIFFRRLSKPVKVKGWGIVYNENNKQPIGQVVARLFNAQFDKQVASQITDRRGRYYFLAGDDKYYVTFEHANYQSSKTGVVDLTGKNVSTVTKDVGLKPTTSAPNVNVEKPLLLDVKPSESPPVESDNKFVGQKDDIYG